MLLTKLGFIIQPIKSFLKPTQIIKILGFIINSISMRIYLTKKKVEKIINMCTGLLSKNEHTIRYVAKVVGTLVATFPAVKFGPLYYRNIDMCKNAALKKSKGNFSATMTLNEESKNEIWWWIQNIATAYNDIYNSIPSTSIETDASKTGWGANRGRIKNNGH